MNIILLYFIHNSFVQKILRKDEQFARATMSYNKVKTNDGIFDYFANVIEFHKISPHLITAKSLDEFEVWFEQAELIDKRSLFLFLCKNKNKIKQEYLDSVRTRFLFI